ncbi:hypothetical protein Q3G72_027408 [Acer saccharum]|nr:hypothetical protein Q3G72_027408 [Acer saccharum]
MVQTYVIGFLQGFGSNLGELLGLPEICSAKSLYQTTEFIEFVAKLMPSEMLLMMMMNRRTSNVVWDGLKEEWEQKLVKSTFPVNKKDMGMLTNYLFIFRV